MRNRGDFYTELGRKIEAKRKQRKAKQWKLARAIGVHRNTLSRWEGGAEMTLWEFLRLCEALSMPHTMMLPGEELPSGILLRQLIRERDPKAKVA